MPKVNIEAVDRFFDRGGKLDPMMIKNFLPLQTAIEDIQGMVNTDVEVFERPSIKPGKKSLQVVKSKVLESLQPLDDYKTALSRYYSDADSEHIYQRSDALEVEKYNDIVTRYNAELQEIKRRKDIRKLKKYFRKAFHMLTQQQRHNEPHTTELPPALTHTRRSDIYLEQWFERNKLSEETWFFWRFDVKGCLDSRIIPPQAEEYIVSLARSSIALDVIRLLGPD